MLHTTTTKFRTGALALLTGAVLLGTTACGGQSLSETEPAGDGGRAAAVEFMPVPDEDLAQSVLESIEVNEELAKLVPDAIRSEGLKAVTSVGYPPMEEWGTNGKDIIGVDPAIAHGIARTLGLKMTLVDQEFNSMIPGLMSGRYDMLLSSMTDTPERQETTTFVDYVSAGNAFLVAAGNPEKIAAPADLCGKIVAVVDSGSSAGLADGFSADCEAAGEAPYEILKFDGDSGANLAVQSGRAVATITDYPVAAARAAIAENEQTAVQIEGDESLWGIGIDKKNTELVDAVQAALQAMIDNGDYEKILTAWNVEGMAIDTALVNGGK
ncbi:ABC transporter substrate-binding protein [Leucobacter sp. M11]|uniref:ABC transporter substrate-binding protein n=1 Tax=Leucobacter sp. M11 TaxID=2993565 RepID=UPI002D80C995|nr:ABC transporter substrate-binding protein [Leucobacter sp. M11]MEB4614378.1 ABC transporter substrate-binding protein [Leucobacter sp. M11]